MSIPSERVKQQFKSACQIQYSWRKMWAIKKKGKIQEESKTNSLPENKLSQVNEFGRRSRLLLEMRRVNKTEQNVSLLLERIRQLKQNIRKHKVLTSFDAH